MSGHGRIPEVLPWTQESSWLQIGLTDCEPLILPLAGNLSNIKFQSPPPHSSPCFLLACLELLMSLCDPIALPSFTKFLLESIHWLCIWLLHCWAIKCMARHFCHHLGFQLGGITVAFGLPLSKQTAPPSTIISPVINLWKGNQRPWPPFLIKPTWSPHVVGNQPQGIKEALAHLNIHCGGERPPPPLQSRQPAKASLAIS